MNLIIYTWQMIKQPTHGQSIALQNIDKHWDGVAAVDGINLSVDAGTFTVLLGPSGCGKSTTLRIIAGLEFADSGAVVIGERNVSALPPVQRDIAMVFQSYALFPHLNVAENILFGLKVRRTAKAEQRQRLTDTATMLGLSPYLHRKPNQLSGGQQQRVALGRAIIAEKSICLMDEPLSNLDAKLRQSMRTEIRELQQKLGFTMVYVTHDQAEAITMADQVVLLNNGRIEQAASPQTVYQRPASAFVASFIGTPPMNLMDSALFYKHLSNTDNHSVAPDSRHSGFILGVRTEHVRLSSSAGLRATVAAIEYMGADTLVDCRIEETHLLVRVTGPAAVTVDTPVTLSWDTHNSHFFAADSGLRTEALTLDAQCFNPI